LFPIYISNSKWWGDKIAAKNKATKKKKKEGENQAGQSETAQK